MSEQESKVMGLFIDNAKTYVQLSIGALVLSVTFLREVLGTPKEQKLPVSGFLVTAWVCFLVAVLAGAFYQYHAVKYIERNCGLKGVPSWFERFDREPYLLYGTMLVSFAAGCLCFTITAITVWS
jgi:hypothetical protein